ncbi:MAG: hypothetical protein V9E88_01080 [Ferruginibacter sp.]
MHKYFIVFLLILFSTDSYTQISEIRVKKLMRAVVIKDSMRVFDDQFPGTDFKLLDIDKQIDSNLSIVIDHDKRLIKFNCPGWLTSECEILQMDTTDITIGKSKILLTYTLIGANKKRPKREVKLYFACNNIDGQLEYFYFFFNQRENYLLVLNQDTTMFIF